MGVAVQRREPRVQGGGMQVVQQQSYAHAAPGRRLQFVQQLAAAGTAAIGKYCRSSERRALRISASRVASASRASSSRRKPDRWRSRRSRRVDQARQRRVAGVGQAMTAPARRPWAAWRNRRPARRPAAARQDAPADVGGATSWGTSLKPPAARVRRRCRRRSPTARVGGPAPAPCGPGPAGAGCGSSAAHAPAAPAPGAPAAASACRRSA